jgi:hypothetical protein
MKASCLHVSLYPGIFSLKKPAASLYDLFLLEELYVAQNPVTVGLLSTISVMMIVHHLLTLIH